MYLINFEIFEPIFFVVYSKYNDISNLVQIEEIKDKFSGILQMDENKIMFHDNFVDIMKGYFNRFSLKRDDELILKGWWEIVIDKESENNSQLSE